MITTSSKQIQQQQTQLDDPISNPLSKPELKQNGNKISSSRHSSESATNSEGELRDKDDQLSRRRKQTDINFKKSECRKQTSHKTEPFNVTNKDNLLLTASDYKIAGNKLCALFRYDEAIIYYTKAISKNSDVPIFYSNRALCYLKLQQWQQAIHDCRKALEIEPDSIKAHFFLGQALAKLNNYEEALKHLQRAHELAKEEKLNFGDDITYQIRLVKRRKWTKIEDESAQLEDELQNYLINLIIKDREAKLLDFQERLRNKNKSENDNTDKSWQPTPSSSTLIMSHASSDENLIENEESIIKFSCDNYIEKLEVMFNDLKLKRKKREVPDYLCGKISFEIMRDPVITPSGITYDRQDIEEHFKRVGHFDPLTRSPLESSQLISNLAMKEVVDAYVKENEWALYY